MIARLRGRHRRTWVVLLLVAPMVIAAAMMERRADAARQSLSAALTSELPPELAQRLDDPNRRSGAMTTGRWIVEPDVGGAYFAAGPTIVPVDIDTSRWSPFKDEVVVYWSRKAGSADATAAEETLPDDAVLLGAWRLSQKFTLALPSDALDGRDGALLWYSLAQGSVVMVRRVDDIERDRR